MMTPVRVKVTALWISRRDRGEKSAPITVVGMKIQSKCCIPDLIEASFSSILRSAKHLI